jgi:hypothetical protein
MCHLGLKLVQQEVQSASLAEIVPARSGQDRGGNAPPGQGGEEWMILAV